MAARKHFLVLLTLLTAACTAEQDGRPVAAPRGSSDAKAQSTKVSGVVDGRTVDLADGTRVRVSFLAEPPPCAAAAAREFAVKTLQGKDLTATSVRSGEISLALPDGTDYALAAVRAGMLRVAGVDGGPLTEAETKASQAKAGLWGPSCAAPSTPPTVAPPPSPCVVVYRVGSQWPGAFQADVTVRNVSDVLINGWTLRWRFADGQTVTQMWNATASQSGAEVSVTNADYAALIVANGSVSIGFNGAVSGPNSAPESFTLNDAPCTTG
ncbi:cellulose binding domain-containing protein [Lentzea sp. NPDC059081]|uniref:cellulose binding domain-containing protein n=1 Tax=Lentzea sp. NPDC059081 TaxID=3346719 RepID=UPI00369E3BE8